MADAPAVSHGKGLDLTKKVGPLPLWVWAVAAAGIWWYFQKQSAKSSASAVPNQQTDPAGNVGTIDPSTGYVYGTPEDTASLASQNAGSTGTGTAGTNATTGAQTYADNNSWGIAAVTYLVGVGVAGTTANQAIEDYLNSQPLTSAEQSNVNMAIQHLGPPPVLPSPAVASTSTSTSTGSTGTGSSTGSTSSGTTSSAPAGNTTSTVSGGHVVSVNNNDAVIAWSHAGPATSWRVTRVGPGGTQTNTVGIPQATYSGLAAGHNYEVTVQPLPTGQPGEITFKTTG